MKSSVYEMSYLSNVIHLWNILTMECPVYEMSFLRNVLYMKCPSSIKCPTSMKCPRTSKCPDVKIFGLENVHQYSSVQLNRNRLFILICPPYYRFLKIGKYLGENWAYCLVSYFQVFSCSIQPFSPFSLALTVCADFSSVLIHHQVLK